jgi:hypothetical protein
MNKPFRPYFRRKKNTINLAVSIRIQMVWIFNIARKKNLKVKGTVSRKVGEIKP